MASPTGRQVRQLVGGLLAGALAAVAWAASRLHSTADEPPSTASLPPGPEPAADPPTDAAASRTASRPDIRALLVVATSVGLAGAVALVPLIVHAGAWRLPLAIVGGVLLLAGCVFLFPRLLVPPRVPEDLAGVQELSAKDRIQLADDRSRLQNDVRTALLQAVAGGAVLVGVLFTWQQQQATLQQQEVNTRQVAHQLAVTRQGQVGERFSRAVGQLGDASIDVRLGGLYELEQLARQAPERRLVIIEVLGAYARQHAGPPANTEAPGPRRLPQDVAAALTIIGRRSIQGGDPQADLTRANFAGVDLNFVVLPQVNLTRADLRKAHLSGANLSDGTLRDADLRGADLDNANLRDADLRYAILEGASLNDADLRDADLSGAALRGAFLGRTDLRGADLGHADLSGAFLNGTDVRGADLGSADLRGTFFLRDTDLGGAFLRDARANESTRWPDGFDWRRAGVKYWK